MNFILPVLFFTSILFGQEYSPVKWSFEMQELGNDEYILVYRAKIDKGWTVYSQFIDEGGPIPTSIWYENESIIEKVGPANETGHRKEGMDPFFEMHVIKYLDDEDFVIDQKIHLKEKGGLLKGYLTFMTCDDERCLPPEDVEFQFDFSSGKAGITIGLDAKDLAQIEGNAIDQTREKLKETYQSPVGNCGTDETAANSLLLMFVFGFLGGLLALLTPCVFPMIPLTVSFFTKDTNKKAWWNGTVYGLSIIVIYVSIGLLITAFFGDEALNRLSTNWIANSIFFLIFLLFAFSFFGFYEITLPSSWSNKSDKLADKGGIIGIFFMAFTLAIVSFSCTGPIIGTAIVQSATSQIGPFTVMLGFSIALALPFGLFAAFPGWLNSLPKSGGWMNSVKVVLGFIELALAFKFLSVADMTNHWGILRYELFLGIWILVSLAMAAYGLGFIKFPHDSPLKKLSPRRWAFSIASLLLALYLSTGFMYRDDIRSYNSLGLLSGLAPPSNYNFFLEKPVIDSELKNRFPSYTKCANNIDCFKDYYEGLAYAKEVGKPLLLDHTGYGCVNCRKMEEHVWVDEEVRQLLNDHFVLVSLYADDDRPLDEELISIPRNKKMRNVGNKWADFQIVNFGQNSQPLYVMISHEEEVLAYPRGYKEGIQDYINYLNCGLETFNSLSSR